MKLDGQDLASGREEDETENEVRGILDGALQLRTMCSHFSHLTSKSQIPFL